MVNVVGKILNLHFLRIALLVIFFFFMFKGFTAILRVAGNEGKFPNAGVDRKQNGLQGFVSLKDESHSPCWILHPVIFLMYL